MMVTGSILSCVVTTVFEMNCNTGKWHRHACNLQNTRTSFAIFYVAILFGSFRSSCRIGCSTMLRCLQSSEASGSFQPRGGYSIYPLVGRCGRAPHTLTLFKTNIADFPSLFKTEFRLLIPCLRHLTRILINKSL